MWQEIHQGKCETHVLLFTSINYESKLVSDQLMLVFCFHSHTFVIYLRTTKVYNNSVFKELTLLFLLQKSQMWKPPMPSDSNRKCPHSFGIPVQRTPLPFGNPKSRPWYRYGYFLESSNEWILFLSFVSFPQQGFYFGACIFFCNKNNLVQCSGKEFCQKVTSDICILKSDRPNTTACTFYPRHFYTPHFPHFAFSTLCTPCFPPNRLRISEGMCSCHLRCEDCHLTGHDFWKV